MIERGQMLYDQNNNPVFYPDPRGDWWKWGAHCFRKKSGRDWLYAIAKMIEKIKASMNKTLSLLALVLLCGVGACHTKEYHAHAGYNFNGAFLLYSADSFPDTRWMIDNGDLQVTGDKELAIRRMTLFIDSLLEVEHPLQMEIDRLRVDSEITHDRLEHLLHIGNSFQNNGINYGNQSVNF